MPWISRISTKFSLLAIVLIIITALALDRVYFTGSRDIMIGQQRKELQNETVLLLTQISSDIKELKNDIRLLSASDTLQQVVQHPEDSRLKNRLADEFLTMLYAKPQYFQVRLIGVADNGREVVRVERHGKTALIKTPESELQRKGDSEYFRKAISMEQDLVYLSGLEPNQEYGAIVRPVVQVLRAGIPIYTNNKIFGIVIINMSLESILAGLNSMISANHQLYVTNNRGYFLYHPQRQYVYGVSDNDRRIEDEFPETANTRYKSDLADFIQTDSGLSLAYALKPFDDLDRKRFIGIGVTASHETLFGQIERVRLNSLYLAVVMVIGGVVLATLLATWIARPLRQITNGVQRFAEKGEKISLPTEQRDETGVLARSFGKLREQLEAHEWLRSGQIQLTEALRGELTPQEMARVTLQQLAQYMSAALGAFYRLQANGELRLLESFAIRGKAEAANQISAGETVLATAIAQRKLQNSSDLPQDYFQIHSGLGNMKPDSRLVLPLQYQGRVIAVLELARVGAFTAQHCGLLEQVEESIGLALVVAESREELRRLLDESQQQQEELRVANEELEEQTTRLEESQDELKTQQTELEAINVSMEEKNKVLEEQNRRVEQQAAEIEQQKHGLEEKAAMLEQASRYKSEFLANMSHELRTPLNSLLILSRALHENEDGNLNDEQVEDAGMIYHGGMELLQLINDILDLSKVEAGKTTVTMEHIAVAELGEKLQRQFLPTAKEKKLQLDLQLDAQLPETLYSDIQKIQQILKNLLSNAIKFTEKGQVSLQIISTGEKISFSVSDTGVGIDTSKLESVFDAFQQEDGSIDRRYGGTGLGLTIARKLARLLGGDIVAQSQKGIGSTFTLQLPLHVDNPVVPQHLIAPVAETGRSASQHTVVSIQSKLSDQSNDSKQGLVKTLLIIEDDPNFAKTLSRLAKQRGYQPITVATGKEGLLVAHVEKPAAIILDLMLPDIDGIKVLEQLKDGIHTRHIPVHIISARVDSQQLTLRKGAAGYLTKPPDPEDIEQVFAQIYQRQQKPLQRVLIIEDDLDNQKAIGKLLKRDQLEIDTVADGGSGLDKMRKQSYDCVILDLQLPDMTGFDWLETVDADQELSVPPVIVYTARKLTRDETRRLEAYTGSIIIKGAHSPERLLDEVTLFLHSVESSLSTEQRRIIRMQHDPGKLLANRKILLVDDDMRNVFALSKQLKKHGMNVIVADNGELALQKLQMENDIELVIMDIMMPVMDGYEATRRIRELPEFCKLPIIALTARTMPDEQQKCFDAGANDYLSKPVDIDVLITLMRVLLFKEEAAA